MSEGWNIAILGATGAVGEALLETLAERQFPVGRSLPWRVMRAQVSICVMRANRFAFRMRLNLTGPRRSWPFSSPVLKLPQPILKTPPMRAVW